MADRYLIGINALFLDHPRTGTGVYTREVLTRLVRSAEATASRDGALRYVVVGHPEHAAACAAFVPYVRLQAPLRRRSQNAEKVLWEQLALPLATARLGVDLLYAPYFSLPLVSGVRTVVTVHDLIPLLLPEYAPSIGFKAYFRLVSAATRHAAAVVADSHCSARDIARLLGVPPERIHVVYLGVDPRYTDPPLPPERVEALRARLGLPERFILYMGGIAPHKNVGVLLRAQRGVRDRGQRALPLVIVAPHGRLPARWERGDPRTEAARLAVESDVLFLDQIPDEDKPALYAAATAFAWPSRYEGFGLPPLEAMASGTPVLCSTSSSLPEVTGDAALGLDPDDVDAWAEGFVRIAQDEPLRARLAAQGRQRAAAFTWDRTVSGLRGVFRQVLAASPGTS